jgi:ribonuclease Z
MPELVVLGTAASVPDAEHDTIGLVLRGSDWSVLIDCGGSPLYKLARAGVEMDRIRALILTHHHADHVYGLPMLVQGLWLSKRRAPLPIYGPGQALDTAHRLLEAFHLAGRDDMFPLEWHPIALSEGETVIRVGGVQIRATPVCHGRAETVALRFDDVYTGRSAVYSADTEPCPALIRLAAGADHLLHEATGEVDGHSSPAQAASVAQKAGVTFLVLIHYPVRRIDLDYWRSQAASFPGPVILAQDGDSYPL